MWEIARVAEFDLMWCERYLVAYLELMTPPEQGGCDPWTSIRSREFGGNFNFIDINGRALTTAITVSYSRPWSRNRGIDGKTINTVALFESLKDAYPAPFADAFDEELHKRIVRLRNSVIAHSDLQYWEFQVYQSGHSRETAIDDPFRYLGLGDARNLLENTKVLRAAFGNSRRLR